jgi:muramidase (phage lysozyme)
MACEPRQTTRVSADLIQQRNVEDAFARLNRIWVSLPGGSQQAKGLTVTEAKRRFESYVAEYMR